ncbi:uncharacterized protein LOC122261429 [Penaeus japonicus]|uniref:uncharacterized protein LOC122261429 n=1 Tax=Penaeus japonicus TaxID=27405 RepID=UPI001C70DCF7|nr:uncharacterized protein LOC122261429 [Penaeus japonicus]
MAFLGFVLPQRRPSGNYETSWVRLIPMMTIAAILVWHLYTYRITFINGAYDVYVDLFLSVTCIIVIAVAFVLAVCKRRETCNLFKALDGKLESSRVWVSVALSSLFIMDLSLFVTVNYVCFAGTFSSLVECLILALVYPIIPLLLDLHVIHLMRALNQVYSGTLSRVLSQGRCCVRTSYSHSGVEDCSSSGCPSGSSFVLQESQPKSAGQVNFPDILEQCDSVLYVVDLHNQVFSSWTLVRCGALMAKLLNASYYLALFFGRWLQFAGSLLYVVNEVGIFLCLCRQADLLKDKHGQLEDALLTLQQQPNTPMDDRFRLLSLFFRLKNHPAHISIGSVGVLGSHILVTVVNVVLTFTAILYQ